MSNGSRGIIVAMNNERIIGINGKLPWHYSTDLKRFRELTMGDSVIMGRKTWESIGSVPLPGRYNIVISRNKLKDVNCYKKLEDALIFCSIGKRNVWIIGGAQLYESALPYVDFLDVTIIPDIIEETDGIIRFPKIDLNIWEIFKQTDINGLKNIIYKRKN